MKAQLFQLKQIVSFTVPANLASRRVMEKIGMRHDEADAGEHTKDQTRAVEPTISDASPLVGPSKVVGRRVDDRGDNPRPARGKRGDSLGERGEPPNR